MKNTKQLRTILYGAGCALVLAALAPLALAEGQPAKAKPYPLKTCVVSGEELGGMGDPYVFTHEGREIKLCCKGCLKKFNKDSASFLKKLDAAEKKGPTPVAPAHDHGGHQH